MILGRTGNAIDLPQIGYVAVVWLFGAFCEAKVFGHGIQIKAFFGVVGCKIQLCREIFDGRRASRD